MTGTPVDVGRLLRDLHAARAEVERLRAELGLLAERIDARRRAVPKTPPDDYAHGEAHGLYLAGRIARGWAGA